MAETSDESSWVTGRGGDGEEAVCGKDRREKDGTEESYKG